MQQHLINIVKMQKRHVGPVLAAWCVVKSPIETWSRRVWD